MKKNKNSEVSPNNLLFEQIKGVVYFLIPNAWSKSFFGKFPLPWKANLSETLLELNSIH